MDSIISYIQEFNFNRETLILLMVLLSTMLIVSAIFFVVMGGRTPVKKRLDTITPTDMSIPTDKKAKSRIEALSPILTPQNEKEREDIRTQLIRAGFHDESAISYFYVIKVVTSFLGFVLSGGYYLFAGGDVKLLYLVLPPGLGLFLPNIILDHLMKERQKRIKRGVPDALDLLVVCTESGLGLNMALMRVAREIALSHPDLADELDMVCLKIKAGYEMSHAFNDMVHRTGITELNGLVSMLSHAARIGGSLAQTLRDYNEDFRDKRQQALEEIAAKIPTKMVFPMLFCIWPTLFIVIIGPVALKAIDVFSTLGR